MENINLLHLTNDYSGSTVYMNLIDNLDDLGITQTVYNPIRHDAETGKNLVRFKNIRSTIIYSKILNKTIDRIIFRSKIKKLVYDVQRKVNVSNVEFIHAHTWFSDGAVAYELHKKYKVPYIVTVRNTDLNIFFKYMLHLRYYSIEILNAAEKIIFISPIYAKRFISHPALAIHQTKFASKLQVIQNGVDRFWIENVRKRRDIISSPVQLIYVGKFDRGKNVDGLVKAVMHLNRDSLKYHLHIVGGSGNIEGKILNLIRGVNSITFHGKISCKSELRELLQKSDIFTMPSHNETFGLVYIESLTQGIPVVYTKNEGIDGYYDSSIGEAVNSKIISSIANGIEKIASNYQVYNFNPQSVALNHDWKKIAVKYLEIYNILKYK